MKRLLFISGFTLLLAFLNSCKTHDEFKIRPLSSNYTGKVLVTDRGKCKVVYDDIDKLTGVRITELAQEKIFSFTHEKLKPFFPDRPFIECYAGLSLSQNNIFLNITFKIDIKNIKTGYKGLSKGDVLIITLINGEKVYAKNTYCDAGKRIPNSNKIIYKGTYLLKKGDIKLMKKYEVDKIGVFWNGGYEEYDVHNIDFFIRQYNCLKKII